MLVDQVQGVPGELGATTGVAANQISILVTYRCPQLSATRLETRQKFDKGKKSRRTGDLPDQVVGDVGALDGHGDGNAGFGGIES